MTTKTMALPEDLIATIEDFARRYHLTPEDFVRLSVEKFVAMPKVGTLEEAKDLLLNDPEALRAVYAEAEEEDYYLAHLGVEAYNRLLKEEEEDYS